jgi:hypothetical protein
VVHIRRVFASPDTVSWQLLLRRSPGSSHRVVGVHPAHPEGLSMSVHRKLLVIWLCLMAAVAISAMVVDKYCPSCACKDCVKWRTHVGF